MDTGILGSNNKRPDKRPLDSHQPVCQSPKNARQSTSIRTSRNKYKQLNTHSRHVQFSKKKSIQGPRPDAQNGTQTHGSSFWSAKPAMSYEKEQVNMAKNTTNLDPRGMP